MNTLVYIESENGVAKKASLEAVSYAAAISKHFNGKTIVLSSQNLHDAQNIGNYGADKLLLANTAELQADQLAQLLHEVMESQNIETVVLPKSIVIDLAAAILVGKTGASSATNVSDLPDFSKGFVVKKSVFTGKAFAEIALQEGKKVLTIKKNSVPLNPSNNTATVENYQAAAIESKVVVKEVKKQTGELLLTDADIVVSAGRGMKAPENWGMVENLAKTLGAATACSKPVSDMDWRPHHEHVGQTGIKVSPNLYIAIGISGAIQHLAGVNSSKTIVVINKDPEAPFFKSADYGIVGDAFEILPKLNEAFKAAL